MNITAYLADHEPKGPFHLVVPARRTVLQRFNDLDNPERILRGVDHASVITGDVPIVVQHTMLDSRRAPLALLSTVLVLPLDSHTDSRMANWIAHRTIAVRKIMVPTCFLLRHTAYPPSLVGLVNTAARHSIGSRSA